MKLNFEGPRRLSQAMVSKTTKAKKIFNLISSEQTRTLLLRRSLKKFFEYLVLMDDQIYNLKSGDFGNVEKKWDDFFSHNSY